MRKQAKKNEDIRYRIGSFNRRDLRGTTKMSESKGKSKTIAAIHRNSTKTPVGLDIIEIYTLESLD